MTNDKMVYLDIHILLCSMNMQEEVINATVPAGRVKIFHCAFFNYTGAANRTGAWSYRGMRFEMFNGTHVQCKASHLTSFVVLVSIVPSEDLVSMRDFNLSFILSFQYIPFAATL